MLFLRHGIQHDWKDSISGVHVHVSPGSAETLVRRGGLTNHRLIRYSLSKISAKNYQNHLICVQVIVCSIIVVFFETRCNGNTDDGDNVDGARLLRRLWIQSWLHSRCRHGQKRSDARHRRFMSKSISRHWSALKRNCARLRDRTWRRHWWTRSDNGSLSAGLSMHDIFHDLYLPDQIQTVT